MAEIRPFVLIQDWMFDLGLNLSEVIAVAVIYGFTQDGMHTCHASLPYFQRRCCVNKRNAIRVLSKLEKMGLLTVGRKAGEQNEYSLNLEVVSKRHQCQNDTSVKIAQSGVKMTPLSPTPPIPIRKDNKKNITSACDAHVCTHEGGSERPPQATPQPPSPPVPSKDEVGLFYVSSMEREAVGFSRDRIAGLKRERMAAALERVAANLAAKEGLAMSEGQKARFLDHWCAHRPGSEAIRAEGDPYFSLYAKAKLWIDIDASRAAAKTAGNSESQFKDATSDWKNRGDF
jgi:hypothetical protein